MATSIAELEQHLTHLQLAHRRHENGALVLSWAVDHHRDPHGDHRLVTVLDVAEDGELVVMYGLSSYTVTSPQVGPALAVCAMITTRVPLVRYAFLHTERRIVPMIHLSVEDGTLTPGQVDRCLHTLVNVIDRYHDVVRLAIEEGRVDPELVENPSLCRPSDDLRDLLDLLPAEVVLDAADRARARLA